MIIERSASGFGKFDRTGLCYLPNCVDEDDAVFKKQWPAFLLAFVLPVVLVYGWWGGFRSASVTQTEAGPYRYAYLDYEGPISAMRKTHKAVLQAFAKSRVREGDTLTVLLSDPRSQSGKVRAQVGYTLAPDAALPQGLKEGVIARRPVLVASVHAAILLAPSKAYQALYEHLQVQGNDIKMPTVEIYRPADTVNQVGVFTLEMNR